MDRYGKLKKLLALFLVCAFNGSDSHCWTLNEMAELSFIIREYFFFRLKFVNISNYKILFFKHKERKLVE